MVIVSMPPVPDTSVPLAGDLRKQILMLKRQASIAERRATPRGVSDRALNSRDPIVLPGSPFGHVTQVTATSDGLDIPGRSQAAEGYIGSIWVAGQPARRWGGLCDAPRDPREWRPGGGCAYSEGSDDENDAGRRVRALTQARAIAAEGYASPPGSPDGPPAPRPLTAAPATWELTLQAAAILYKEALALT